MSITTQRPRCPPPSCHPTSFHHLIFRGNRKFGTRFSRMSTFSKLLHWGHDLDTPWYPSISISTFLFLLTHTSCLYTREMQVLYCALRAGSGCTNGFHLFNPGRGTQTICDRVACSEKRGYGDVEEYRFRRLALKYRNQHGG